jgi:hypothetical protein
MKKIAIILAGLVLLALLVLVLVLFTGAGPSGPASGNASAANATPGQAALGNATLAAVLPGNATSGNATAAKEAGGNATSANATSGNATSANATAAGPPPVPHDLLAGTYLSAAVANATLADLREKGVAPTLFIRPDDAGAVWWEVHLGRFPDLAPALAEADRLGRDKGVWVRPRPVDPKAKPAAAAKGPSTVYMLSAGQYLSRHAADERARELAGLGFEPCVVRMPTEGGQMWYAVAVGQAKSEEEAAALSAGLAAKTGLPGRVSAEDAASLAGRKLCE